MLNENLFGEIVENDDLRTTYFEPPFSVIDGRKLNWVNRKKKWRNLGIKSHLGRDAKCNPPINLGYNEVTGLNKYGRKVMTEKSIFDPVLAELLYKWFCNKGDEILDPFAGGSVRGIVANYLGYKYTGIDIRKEQIESNIQQAENILPSNNQPNWICGDSDIILEQMLNNKNITPIEKINNIYIKRDDLFAFNGAIGGKSRAALYLIQEGIKKGFDEFVTAGSRKSPQINIIARIAEYYGKKFTAFTPCGALGEELQDAIRHGANINQVKMGYNNVIISKAKKYAEMNKAYYIPFGMNMPETISLTAEQVSNIPKEIKRIVIPVGSGVNLAGLLYGLKNKGLKIPVLGVVVGKNPEKYLDENAPKDWRNLCKLVYSDIDYHKEKTNIRIGNILLDPIYEAKVKNYLKDDDLLWIIGLRNHLAEKENYKKFAYNNRTNKPLFDFIFSCPPYGNMEVYSNLEGDISNKNYEEFLKSYYSIISKSCQLLKKGKFACFVVSDFRDKDGYYYDFISHTKKAFIKNGCKLYNEIIYLQPLGTAMLRAKRVFGATKKVIKVHENILVFKKI